MNVVFNTKRRRFDPHRDTLSCTSDCSACDQEVHFWVTDMVAHANPESKDEPAIYMLPSSTSTTALDFKNYQGKIPDSILKYCLSAQDVYVSGNLTAANVLIQAAMVSIFSDILPDSNSKSNLPQMIQTSLDSINLNEPLENLHEDMINGGNLEVLLQHHDDTTQESADTMMALLETLLSYLYVVPNKFKELQEQFERINMTHKMTRRGDENVQSVDGLKKAG